MPPVSIEAQVVERVGNTSVVHLSKSSCAGCASRCQGSQVLALAGDLPERLVLTVESGELARIFWYTLGLPLSGFVAGSWLVDVMFASDLMAFAGGVTGLAVGVLVCRNVSRRQFLESIKISKAD